MSRSVIDEIKERLDIVEVVGQYVRLKRSGRSYSARCPFHNEKTPSFHVFPETGTWRCFGACGTGGDVISYVQKKENLDFSETLQLLAQRAGVELHKHKDPKVLTRLNKLREINKLAATYFSHQLLQTSEGQEARTYLQKRGISAESIERFQLGFARESWDHLSSYLQKRGYSADDLEAVGLVGKRERGGVYDRFRNRLIIPIHDIQGHTVGFGGRILGDGEPKYLNTSQTPLFDKSTLVFALDLAKRAIRSKDQVVLVEGYMDVISTHQFGYKNVVAAMGTSITPQQLKRLSRYSKNFVFALDADAAGVKATLRSIHVLRETLSTPTVPVPTASGSIRYEQRLKASVKIAAMPAGQDPDDVLQADPANWQRLIDEAMPLVDYYFKLATDEEDLTTAAGKAHLVHRLLPIISEIDDAIEQRHYVSKLAGLAGVIERKIDQQLQRFTRSASRARASKPKQKRRPTTRPAPPPRTSPPKRTVGASHEPPPLQLDALNEPALDDLEDNPFDETVDAPRQQALPPIKKSADIVMEERVLAYLIYKPTLQQWADSELAELSFFPINLDDFVSTSSRAIFDVLTEFLYSNISFQTNDLSQQLDSALKINFESILTLAQDFEALREEQLRKDIVDVLLRLRHRRARQACQSLEILLREPDQVKLALREYGPKLKETRDLERAIASRSNSAKWMSDQQRYQPQTTSS